MATNSFESLLSDVNRKVAEMNTAISGANAAAAQAREAAGAAAAQVTKADSALSAANDAVKAAEEETAKWAGTSAEAQTLEPGSDATAALSEAGGAKKLTFGIPRGEKGDKGDKGEPGKSGLTFSLSGTILNITKT